MAGRDVWVVIRPDRRVMDWVGVFPAARLAAEELAAQGGAGEILGADGKDLGFEEALEKVSALKHRDSVQWEDTSENLVHVERLTLAGERRATFDELMHDFPEQMRLWIGAQEWLTEERGRAMRWAVGTDGETLCGWDPEDSTSGVEWFNPRLGRWGNSDYAPEWNDELVPRFPGLVAEGVLG